jgi:3',5'-cyclic AMP phosphodiesterase CpdA
VYSVAEQIAAIEVMIQRERFDVIAVSGDLTQRARRGEFLRAREFLDAAKAVSRVIAVPGNHDVTWWRAPMHIGSRNWMYSKWRNYLARDIDPVIRLTGATIVGVNTAHGVSAFTLTTRARDLSVIGDLRDEQIERVAHEFEFGTEGRRIVVMHHNPVAGELSGRFGLKHSDYVLKCFAKLHVDLILCGHDHQEAIHYVEHTAGGIVVSIAGTITTRSRGGRPASVNVIEFDDRVMSVRTRVWDGGQHEFVAGPERRFEK